MACAAGLALVLAPLAWIVESTVQRAVAGWRWGIFVHASTGTGGGLANALAGTAAITAGVVVLAGTAGVGTGVFLAEVARPGRLASIVRLGAELLSGVPSIVFGYCGYLALVVGLHWGFSLLAAVLVLALLVVPYVAKSTELALGQVPLAYREGGEALGMRPGHLLRRVVLPSALPGILTGLLVAVAISVGETAPLLYTAGYSNAYPSGALVHAQVGYLTYAAYAFYDEPGAAARALSADAAVLLLALVVLAITASRLVVRRAQRYAPDASPTGRAGAPTRRRSPSRAGGDVGGDQ